jgi:hypothetical protein
MGNVGFGVGQESPARISAATRCFGNAAVANGAVDTIVMRFLAANITLNGSFTLVENANNGTILTCARPGLWWMSLWSNDAAVDLNIGIGLNAAAAGALTTEPDNFDAVDAAAGTEGIETLAGDTNIAADGPHLLQCSFVRRLVDGDTLRFYATVAATVVNIGTRFNCEMLVEG